jgi:hypothetical protein
MDNDPNMFPGYEIQLVEADSDESEEQAQAPSAIGPAVEVSRECLPVPVPTPAPTIAPGAIPDAAPNSGNCRHALSPLTNAGC